jgi:hypothetical protein
MFKLIKFIILIIIYLLFLFILFIWSDTKNPAYIVIFTSGTFLFISCFTFNIYNILLFNIRIIIITGGLLLYLLSTILICHIIKNPNTGILLIPAILFNGVIFLYMYKRK